MIHAHKTFLLLFGLLSLALLHPLFGTDLGFTQGDYDLQFYPWTHFYAEYLLQGKIQIWNPFVQSGFYMFAEGQVGMLYLINLILFRNFEFNAAWNAVLILHFLMGGCFTYVYCTKLKLSRLSATLCAMLFSFGSPYAGCFYNLVTMRSLVWFPLMLFLTERILTDRCRMSVFVLAFAVGQSWLGGFAQTAGYATGFLMLYFIIRAFELRQINFRICLMFGVALFSGILIAVPQIWATLELAAGSSRTLQPKEFALWGSFAPWSSLTFLAYPWRGFLKTGMYIGIIPLLFVLITPVRKYHRASWWLLIFSLLLALGRFNPLYYLLLELPIASLLRNPSKFLFFFTFFLIIISGFAWDYWAELLRSDDAKQKLVKRLGICAAAGILIMHAAWLLIRLGEALLVRYGDWYVSKFVLGKSFHRYSNDFYHEKVRNILDHAQSIVSYSDLFFWLPQIFLILAVLGSYAVLRNRLTSAGFLRCLVTLVFLDLYIYGASGYGTGFLGNIGEFRSSSELNGYPQDGKWMDERPEKAAEFKPNRNIFYRYPVLGIYTPIMNLRYHELFSWTGQLDDSVGHVDVRKELFGDRRNLLSFAGVKYFIPIERQKFEPFTEKRMNDISGSVFFENPDAGEEFTWVPSAKVIWNKEERLKYLFSPNFDSDREVVLERKMASVNAVSLSADIEINPIDLDSVEIRVSAENPGYLVRAVSFDKGWKADLNGKKTEILIANHAFQAVAVPSGSSVVNFHFKPNSFILGRWFSLAGYLVVLTGLSIEILSYRRRIR